MIDLKQFRGNPEAYRAAAKAKKSDVDVAAVLALDDENRRLLQDLNRQRTELKSKSRQKPSAAEISRLKKLGETVRKIEGSQAEVQTRLDILLQKIPNVPSADTPVGADARANRVLREVGHTPEFSFPPKPHWELGQALGVLDIERASAVAGTRFVYLKGGLALMQFALIHYALTFLCDSKRLANVASRAGLSVRPTPFVPVIPPVFIRPDVMQKMARLEPRDERYHIPSDNLYLIGSAEHTLGPLHMGETLPEPALPVRYVGYSTAFRREAGSYGKDTKGMIRVHQFDKLEMESFTTPEQSFSEHEFFVAIQEHLMQGLELPYRVMLLCTGDMGTPNARQVDLETWMPGQDQYRETHSADLTTDYQARRLNIRFRRADGQTALVHMNDATVFAVGRTLVAIMENYQQADGTIAVPQALQPFMIGGQKIIGKI